MQTMVACMLRKLDENEEDEDNEADKMIWKAKVKPKKRKSDDTTSTTSSKKKPKLSPPSPSTAAAAAAAAAAAVSSSDHTDFFVFLKNIVKQEEELEHLYQNGTLNFDAKQLAIALIMQQTKDWASSLTTTTTTSSSSSSSSDLQKELANVDEKEDAAEDGKEGGKGKGKKKKKEKDPTAPKRPSSAYVLFGNYRR